MTNQTLAIIGVGFTLPMELRNQDGSVQDEEFNKYWKKDNMAAALSPYMYFFEDEEKDKLAIFRPKQIDGRWTEKCIFGFLILTFDFGKDISFLDFESAEKLRHKLAEISGVILKGWQEFVEKTGLKTENSSDKTVKIYFMANFEW